MYEMYPDRWAETDSRLKNVSERPRRRARKDHRVVPQIVANLEQLRDESGRS